MNETEFFGQLPRMRKFTKDGVVYPYKYVLLLAVLVLHHKGGLVGDAVLLDRALTSVYLLLLDSFYPGQFSPGDARDPYRAIATERIWTLVARPEMEKALHERELSGVWDLLPHVEFARIQGGILHLFEGPVRRLETALHIAGLLPDLDPERSRRKLVEWLGPDAATTIVQAKLRESRGISERVYEELLVTRWEETPFFRDHHIRLADRARDGLPAQQARTAYSNLDILGYQEPSRTWWVMELKYSDKAGDSAVGQVLRYMNYVHEFHAREQERVAGAVVSLHTPPTMLAAARQCGVKVWRVLDGSVSTMERLA